MAAQTDPGLAQFPPADLDNAVLSLLSYLGQGSVYDLLLHEIGLKTRSVIQEAIATEDRQHIHLWPAALGSRNRRRT